jgi:hypothetical protein
VRFRRENEIELKLALRALHIIKNNCGIICEECLEGITHPECRSSQNSWDIAVQTLEKISKVQKGEYAEYNS